MALKFPAVVDKLNQLNWDFLARQFPLSVDKLAAAVQAQLLKPGMIMATGRSSADTGFLLCDGTAVSRTTYSALFAAISTTYGVGDGSTTFNLPDLRGRVPVGVDDAAARLTANDLLGNASGAETHALTITEMPSHGHSTGSTVDMRNAGGVAGSNAVLGTSEAATNVFPLFIASVGGNGAHNNMQPFQIVNFEIKT